MEKRAWSSVVPDAAMNFLSKSMTGIRLVLSVKRAFMVVATVLGD